MRHAKKSKAVSLPFLALYLAVAVVVGGGTAAYGVLSKSVTLSVDGHTQTVRTFGGTVADVLKARGVRTTAQDEVSPSPDTSVHDGTTVEVAYAKPISLVVDGTRTEQVTYATTVRQALSTMDVSPQPGAYLSSRESAHIPRAGIQLVVSNPKQLTVVADGKKRQLTTAAPTVEAVLHQVHVSLGKDDEVAPGTWAFVTDDAVLKVVRIKRLTTTEVVKTSYPVDVQKDSSLVAGRTEVVTRGIDGRKKLKVSLVLADGKVRQRTVLDSDVLAAPTPQVEKHGTKVVAETGNTVWDRLAQCESGGNWHINTGNGYYGGLQFSAATWHSVGGAGLPSSASRAEQIKRGKILQARSGWGQWSCAHTIGLD